MKPVATVSQLEYDSTSGRFAAALTLTDAGMNPIDTRISGRVDEVVEAPVALTRLLPDTVLRADDLRIARVRAATLQNEVARSVDQIIGMQLRRPVAAGQPLRLADLKSASVGSTRCDGPNRAVRGRPDGQRPGGGVGCWCPGRESPCSKPHLACVPVCRGRWTRKGADHTQVAPGAPDGAGALRSAPGAMKIWALVWLGTAASLAGCGTLDRLSEVGRDPTMTPTADPTKDPKWRPLSMPMPGGQPSPNEANSLWRSGSRAFFKDQRAAQVGDIVTVLVNMNDAANLKNVTSTARTSAETGGIPNFFGLEKLVPAVINPATLVTTNSTNNNIGTGQIQRTEAVTLRLAGIVTQVLPNGNLVVAASQEFLVNSELRELRVTGVIRPQDIASDNTVLHDRMAEARIAYGGKGQLTDLQRARWGQQMLDILAPF